MLLDLRHDLRIGQSVSGFDLDNGLRGRSGSTEPLLELPLGLAWPEDEQRLRFPQVIDHLVVVPVEALSVTLLVFPFASDIVLAAEVRMRGDVRLECLQRDVTPRR